MRRIMNALPIVASLAFVPVSAEATTLLPNAYGSLTANVGNGITAVNQSEYVVPGAITVRDLSGDMATAATSFANGGSAAVSINGFQSNANALIGYSFEFTGRSNVLIPIIVSGQVSLTDQGGNFGLGSAGASVEIGWNNAVQVNPFACAGQAVCYFEYGHFGDALSKTFSYNLYIPSNTIASVLVRATAIANGYVGGGDYVRAIADPYIQINQNFANAGQFTFIESAGVVNSPVAAVPEASTWAMLLLGFGGLGFAGYRRTGKNRKALASA